MQFLQFLNMILLKAYKLATVRNLCIFAIFCTILIADSFVQSSIHHESRGETRIEARQENSGALNPENSRLLNEPDESNPSQKHGQQYGEAAIENHTGNYFGSWFYQNPDKSINNSNAPSVVTGENLNHHPNAISAPLDKQTIKIFTTNNPGQTNSGTGKEETIFNILEGIQYIFRVLRQNLINSNSTNVNATNTNSSTTMSERLELPVNNKEKQYESEFNILENIQITSNKILDVENFDTTTKEIEDNPQNRVNSTHATNKFLKIHRRKRSIVGNVVNDLSTSPLKLFEWLIHYHGIVIKFIREVLWPSAKFIFKYIIVPLLNLILPFTPFEGTWMALESTWIMVERAIKIFDIVMNILKRPVR